MRHSEPEYAEITPELRERLEEKIELDDNTARRLFTLICSFHMR